MSYLWVETFKPQQVNDCILPQSLKSVFLQYVKDREFPNLILAGPAGVGKTSVAHALCAELGVDLLFVNASLDRGIGEVRDNVATFASTSSLTGDKKVVILDEADNLTKDSQKALRALIEEFQNHCRFILTCNYPSDIIDAIHSRCNVIDFHLRDPKIRKELSAQFFKRLKTILKDQGVEGDDKQLVNFILSKAPNWRGILNKVQGKVVDGKIENLDTVSVDALANYIVGKDFTKARDWVFENATLNPTEVQRELYNALDDKLVGDQKAVAVMVFAEYAKNMATGADPLITLVALCTTLMSECNFK